MIVYFCFALVIFTIFHPVNPAIYSTSDIIIIKDLVIFAFGMFLSASIGIIMLMILNTRVLDLETGNKVLVLFRFILYSIKSNMPIEKVIKYKIGVCKDYAKLTACLLSNLYNKNKIYFAFSPGHVTAGIEINDRIYVLDQVLPIWSLERWGSKYNKKKTEYTLMNFKRGKPHPIKQPPLISHKINAKINIAELSKDAIGILKIKQSNERISYKEKIPLKKAYFYEADDIIKYSFLRALKNKVYKELPGKVSAIKRINIKLESGVIVLYAFM